MVEDRHLSNTYGYGGNTYYLETLGNNNKPVVGGCVVEVEDESQCGRLDECRRSRAESRPPDDDSGGKEGGGGGGDCRAGIRQQQMPSMGNCIGQQRCKSAHLAAAAHPAPVSNNVSTPGMLRFGQLYVAAETNGSSHVERSPSQSYYDVTKDERGPEGDRGRNGFSDVYESVIRCEGLSAQEFHKTLLAFGILIFNFFLTTTSLAIIHDKVPRYGPLPDAILDLVEAKDWALIVSEVLIIVTTTIMLLIIVVHRARFIIFRRLFLLLSLLYFMRSITMFVTVLPVSSRTYYCSPQKNGTDPVEVLHRSLNLFFGMGLTINGKHIYCGDYIYSGHTTILVMSYLMISEYSSRKLYWLHWATWLMSLTGVLMVLISHSHYTVDVVVGYFVTTRLFWMYHTCANNPNLKVRSPQNYLAREWWFFLFQYFERNVKGPLQPLHYR